MLEGSRCWAHGLDQPNQGRPPQSKHVCYTHLRSDRPSIAYTGQQIMPENIANSARTRPYSLKAGLERSFSLRGSMFSKATAKSYEIAYSTAGSRSLDLARCIQTMGASARPYSCTFLCEAPHVLTTRSLQGHDSLPGWVREAQAPVWAGRRTSGKPPTKVVEASIVCNFVFPLSALS